MGLQSWLRSEYPNTFDMQEPVLKGFEHSEIQVLDALFKKHCPDYKLVDYGPLDSKALEED